MADLYPCDACGLIRDAEVEMVCTPCYEKALRTIAFCHQALLVLQGQCDATEMVRKDAINMAREEIQYRIQNK